MQQSTMRDPASVPSEGGAGARDSAARGGLADLAAWRVRPVSMAHERGLPVLDPLAPLLPDAALVRGSTVSLTGSGATSLALALVSGPVAAGSWVAVVGIPSFGWVAAAEAGIDLERVVVIDAPPSERWSTVVAALVGAFDLVLVAPGHRLRVSDTRRLAARARERGTVFVQLPSMGSAHRRTTIGLEPDICLNVDRRHWSGLGDGHGHLMSCRFEVSTSGRGRASLPRHAVLHLPLTARPAGERHTLDPIRPPASAVELAG